MTLETDITALRKLSRLPRTQEDMDEVHRIIDEENDVAIALVCGTLLEEATEQLLLCSMISLNSEETTELFRGFGPLASLSARTKFAYALGLIGKVTRRHIGMMRDVRNAIAHSKKPLRFDTPEVSAVCGRLRIGDQMPDRAPEVLAEFESDTKEPKVRFTAMTFVIFQQMMLAAMTTPRRRRPHLP